MNKTLHIWIQILTLILAIRDYNTIVVLAPLLLYHNIYNTEYKYLINISFFLIIVSKWNTIFMSLSHIITILKDSNFTEAMDKKPLNKESYTSTYQDDYRIYWHNRLNQQHQNTSSKESFTNRILSDFRSDYENKHKQDVIKQEIREKDLRLAKVGNEGGIASIFKRMHEIVKNYAKGFVTGIAYDEATKRMPESYKPEYSCVKEEYDDQFQKIIDREFKK